MFNQRHKTDKTRSVSFESSVDEEVEDEEDDGPTEEEVREYAESIGINLKLEPELMWIARDGITAPLPSDEWKPIESDDGTLYFFNSKTGQSTWEHPSDEKYRKMVIDERARLIERKTGVPGIKAAPVAAKMPVARVVQPIEPIKKPIGQLAPIQRPGTSAATRPLLDPITPANVRPLVADTTTTPVVGAFERPKTSHGTRSVPVQMAPIKADGARFLKKSANVKEEDMSSSSMTKTPAASMYANTKVQVNDESHDQHNTYYLSDSSVSENEPPKPDVKIAHTETKVRHESLILDVDDLDTPAVNNTSIKPNVNYKPAAVMEIKKTAPPSVVKPDIKPIVDNKTTLVASTIPAIANKSKEDIIKAEEDVEREMQQVITSKRAVLQKAHSQELAKLKRDLADKIKDEDKKLREELEKKHNILKATLIRQHEQEINDLNTNHEAKLAKLKKEHKDQETKRTIQKTTKKVVKTSLASASVDSVAATTKAVPATTTQAQSQFDNKLTAISDKLDKLMQQKTHKSTHHGRRHSDSDHSDASKAEQALPSTDNVVNRARALLANSVYPSAHMTNVNKDYIPLSAMDLQSNLERMKHDLARLNDRLNSRIDSYAGIEQNHRAYVNHHIDRRWAELEKKLILGSQGSTQWTISAGVFNARQQQEQTKQMSAAESQLDDLKKWLNDYEKKNAMRPTSKMSQNYYA